MNSVQAAFEEAFGELLSNSQVSFLYHENGFKLASYNQNKALTPASNTKLFHTAAALELNQSKEVLPPFQVYCDGAIVQQVLKGNLIIDTCGSLFFSGRYPTSLSIEEKQQKLAGRIDEFVDVIRSHGVCSIEGDLKLSFNRWNGIEENSHYNAAVPFLFNENTIDTLVENGSIKVSPDKPLKFVFKSDSTVTSQDKRADNTIYFNPGVSSKDYWRINKTDVNEYARLMLKRELEIRGLKFLGKIYSGDASLLFEIKKDESIQDYIQPINHYSDNLRAELLALQINRQIQGKATYDDLTNSLKKIFGKEVKGIYDFFDGSGLSRQNRCSAASLVSLLEWMSSSANHYAFEQSLAVAGVSGTLAKRFHGTPFERSFIGKTGTLNKVTALSGYWLKDPYTKVTLSFIGNGDDNKKYWQALESFAKKLK